MSNVPALLFASPVLLGMCILLACAVASTSILYFCRPTQGPGCWAACCWLLLASYGGFLFDLLDGQLTLGWLTNLLLVAGQAMMMLGVFRFLQRPLPKLLLPAALIAQALVEYARLQPGASQPWGDAGYCLIIVALAATVGSILLRDPAGGEVRAVRLFIFGSLLAYGLAHLARMAVALSGVAPQVFPQASIPLLSFFTGLPFLIIALVALTAMSLHRILAHSRVHEASARANLHRFEQLMRISSAATLLLRHGAIEDSNPKLGELFGCRREGLHGLPFEVLFQPSTEPPPLTPGQPYHRVAVRADHTTFQAEVLLLELDDEQCLAEVRDVSRQKKLETQLTQLANADPLTGALNRRAFNQRFELARQQPGPLCLALLDLDHFKRINDHFGHAVGDEVLMAFARLCQAEARQGDVFARVGGEEFVFLLPGCELADAQGFLARLAEALAGTSISGLPKGLAVGFSAGVTACPAGLALDAALKRADQALYRAKANGRGRVEHC
ncbi:diguanylate cyclase [Pseudomonas sp. NPDC007930]|uniref:GGDEF domain-containing protein n=1 Tax=Pseudomonas sp. NPDC007930 TaxID=3364417 RepID=UPI0036F162B5